MNKVGIASLALGGILATAALTFFVTSWYLRTIAIDNTLTELAELNKSIKENTDDLIDGIEDGFRGFDHTISLRTPSSGAIEGTSPRALTEFGREISRQIGGQELASSVAPRLATEAKELMPYGIQEFSFNYVYDQVHKNTDFQHAVQKIAYENGISALTVISIIGIDLRDEILKLNEEQGGL